MFVYHIFMTSLLWLDVGPQPLHYKEDYLQIFECALFNNNMYAAFAVSMKVGYP